MLKKKRPKMTQIKIKRNNNKKKIKLENKKIIINKM